MTSEEHLLTKYENQISFKALVTNMNEASIRYQAIGLITAGILPLVASPLYGGHIIGVLISTLWLVGCLTPLKWLQVQMVKNVYPDLYISPWHWDREGFITIQCRILRNYFKKQKTRKRERAELKRRCEKRAEKNGYPVVVTVFVVLFLELWGPLYGILTAHLNGKLRDEIIMFGAFSVLSVALSVLVLYFILLIEMTMTKKRSCLQIVDLMSESEIRSGK